MKRIILKYLKEWKVSDVRKPMILRGARQIGKTTSVRQLGETFEHYVELDFERMVQLHPLFEKDIDPKQIIIDLQLITKQSIIPGKTLLFFDEIQACPRALLSLRYFYELMPELHVIAAGSLLEFAIEKIGIPVGRVNFLYMYPISFLEFLWTMNEAQLADAIIKQNIETAFSKPVHEKTLRLLGEYIGIGGMPEAVTSWREHENYQACLDIHHDLITAYQQDFEKYAKKSQIKYLEHVFKQTPQQLGQQL